MTINRTNRYYNLGLRLCEWHDSGSDPIYAVGSTMIAGKFDDSYSADIIGDAMYNLRRNNDAKAWRIADRLQKILNDRAIRSRIK